MSGFVSRVPLRWVDLDAQGHVNNAVVADYLQEARVDWLLSGPNAHLLGTSTMVVAHQVEYLGPVAFGVDPVEVELRVGSVGAARFTLGYSVVQDGRELARARSVLCLFDYAAMRPRRMTSRSGAGSRHRRGRWSRSRPSVAGRWASGRTPTTSWCAGPTSTRTGT